MSKYGDVAVKATRIAQEGACPIEAWNTAVTGEFGDRIASIKKVCPRSTFLGLAEDGYIKGVSSGSYTRSILNKNYALEALKLLNINQKFIYDIRELWVQSCGTKFKVHNNQMDVVVSLWLHGLLKEKL